MAEFLLHIGNRNYSSWSLRGWLACRLAGIDFDEHIIPLDLADTAKNIAAVSPNERVPCLFHDDIVVWDSLAIAEYLAELKPDVAMWPKDRAARAMARSMAAEMHSSYMGIRNRCPMDMRGKVDPIKMPDEVARDVARLDAAWSAARGKFGADGPYLFGDWSLADCFFAPAVSRCRTYGLPLSDVSAAYVKAVLAHPDVSWWAARGAEEQWVIPHEDASEQKF